MKKIKIAINGFGRIGRSFFRLAFDRSELEIVAINDLGNLNNLAYLLRYDSVYRKYNKKIEVRQNKDEQKLIVDGKEIIVVQQKDPSFLPWKDLNIDVAVESTGFFESFEASQAHLKAGAKRVVISAPAKDKDPKMKDLGRTILLGINEEKIKERPITSNGSCTTNAVAPAIKVMSENPGIKKAVLNSVHAFTATQKLVDGPDTKDWRRGRAAAHNISPSSTGAAISVAEAIPDVKGIFDGLATRVPVITGSMADITFISKRKTSVDEIKEIFKKASKEEKWQGILGVVEDPIVSSDIIGDLRAAIVDLSFIKVIDDDLVKILVWYDNELAYSNTLVEHVIRVGKHI